MIHVCYALYDATGKYSTFLGISIQSLLDNTNEDVTIHILHDSTLSRENRKKLTTIAYEHSQEIHFYDISILAPKKISEIVNRIPSMKASRYSTAAFYRTFTPDLLPKDVDRIIYLDGDTIINLDINEFWKTDMANFSIAAVPQVASGHTHEAMSEINWIIRENMIDSEDYFNSGVLLMDLNQVRKLGGGGDFWSNVFPFSKNIQKLPTFQIKTL